ncbi:MAG: hypothetical protein GY884_23085 [Proteobacteria bacterium]|nr:hypothetical protein [Pseudomonadota bacterium]
MSWYYTREAGAEGTILTDDGEAAGTPLADLLDQGRPPLKACLEIGSAIADILTIAEEDEVVHGDIKPGFVKVDATGAVRLDGFGQPRRTTRAPEGRPDGPATDVFGLGVVLHSLMSDEPLGRLPRDPDAHDDAVVGRVMSMDFSSVQGRRWLEDVQRFLCQVLAYDTEDRPEPLDAANVLAVVAEQCPGAGLQEWAARMLRRSGAPAPQAKAAHEDLAGASGIRAPLPRGNTGQFKAKERQAPSSRGESTQMWSRERIAAMIAEEDEEWEREQLEPARPVGGGRRGAPAPRSAPSWGEEDLAGPTPVGFERPQPEAPRREQPRAPRAAQPAAPRPPAPRPPAQPQAPAAPRPPAPRPPVAQPAPPAQPVAWSPQQPPPPPPAPSETGGDNTLKYVAIAVGVLVLLCMGLSAVGGVAYYVLQPQTGDIVQPQPVSAEDDRPSLQDLEDRFDSAEPDPVDANVEPEPEPPKPAASTTKSTGSSSKSSGSPSKSTGSSTKTTNSSGSSSKSTSSSSSGSSSSKTATSVPTEAATAAVGSKYEAKISVAAPDKVTIRCGDGQTTKFAGAVRLQFAGTVSCFLQQGDTRGVVVVTGAGQYICSSSGGEFLCNGP